MITFRGYDTCWKTHPWLDTRHSCSNSTGCDEVVPPVSKLGAQDILKICRGLRTYSQNDRSENYSAISELAIGAVISPDVKSQIEFAVQISNGKDRKFYRVVEPRRTKNDR